MQRSAPALPFLQLSPAYYDPPGRSSLREEGQWPLEALSQNNWLKVLCSCCMFCKISLFRFSLLDVVGLLRLLSWHQSFWRPHDHWLCSGILWSLFIICWSSILIMSIPRKPLKLNQCWWRHLLALNSLTFYIVLSHNMEHLVETTSVWCSSASLRAHISLAYNRVGTTVILWMHSIIK